MICSVLLTKYYSDDQIKKTEVGRTCNTYGEMRGVYRTLLGKPEGRKPLGRPRPRWEDNIKKYLMRSWMGGMYWIDVAQDMDRWRDLVNTVMDFRVP